MAFTFWKACRPKNVLFFLFCSPKPFVEVSDESPGRLFGRLILPDARAVGAGLLVSLALAIARYCLCHLQGGQLPLSLCCFTPLPGLVLLKLSLSGVLTMFSAPDSERRTALGCSSCSISFFCRLVSFYPSGWLERQLGSLPPVFSPFLFLGSLRYFEVNGCGAGMGLPYRVVPFFSYGVALPPQ